MSVAVTLWIAQTWREYSVIQRLLLSNQQRSHSGPWWMSKIPSPWWMSEIPTYAYVISMSSYSLINQHSYQPIFILELYSLN